VNYNQSMYESFSDDYDRFVNWENRLGFEMPWLLSQLEALREGSPRPLRILDAACGTGMHAIALAHAGYDVTGVDLSEGMIARARANAQRNGVEVRFEVAGFYKLSPALGLRSSGSNEPFDAVLCLGNSLPHLTSLGYLVMGLVDFAWCMHPGGLLLIQNRNFDAVLERRERVMEPQMHREGDTEWQFLRFYDYLPDGLILFTILTRKRIGGGEWQEQSTSSLLYPQLLGDMLRALAMVKYNDIKAFGSMAGEWFDIHNSANLVVTARVGPQTGGI
jgi:glycine/sarcosine N-methyltransferase